MRFGRYSTPHGLRQISHIVNGLRLDRKSGALALLSKGKAPRHRLKDTFAIPFPNNHAGIAWDGFIRRIEGSRDTRLRP